jgi:hypothetical protein
MDRACPIVYRRLWLLSTMRERFPAGGERDREEKRAAKKELHGLPYSSHDINRSARLCSLDFAGLKASCADMDLLVAAVDLSGNSLDIRVPDSVGSSMRMADVVAEMSALATDITFSHLNTS